MGYWTGPAVIRDLSNPLKHLAAEEWKFFFQTKISLVNDCMSFFSHTHTYIYISKYIDMQNNK